MSGISSGEVSGSNGDVNTSEVSEVESPSAEITESDVDEDFSAELDDSYLSYMEDGKINQFEKQETEEVKENDKTNEEIDSTFEHELDSKYSDYLNGKHGSNEIDETDDVSERPEDMDDIDYELDKKYNEYIDEGNKGIDKPENSRGELTEAEKAKLKEETGWSDEVIDSTKSLEEAEIYKKADLKEEEIDGKKCLVRQDIDMEQKDEFGRTNKERMANGNPPLTETGETVELHHIGQKQDSPLAELTTQEHRGKGNDTVLHDKQKESEIDRTEFAKERKHHWESRAETC